MPEDLLTPLGGGTCESYCGGDDGAGHPNAARLDCTGAGWDRQVDMGDRRQQREDGLRPLNHTFRLPGVLPRMTPSAGQRGCLRDRAE